MSVTFSLSPEEQKELGRIACTTIDSCLVGNDVKLPNMVTKTLNEHLGSFVTLEKNGNLRGCIGTMIGQEPLYINVARMAHAAAFQDSRFPKLNAEEWKDVDVSISVLGPLSPCPDVKQVEIGKHGLLLKLGNNSGVFLPKVPVEQGWNLEAYLENLCRKAGLGAGSWQDPKAELYWYEALVFDVER